MKKKDKCMVEWCNKPRKRTNARGFINYCSTHQHNATITSFLNKVYNDMKARIAGKGKDSKYYKGKSLLAKEVFMTWARNHPDFLKLYKQYFMSRFDRRLAPSVTRMDSGRGYSLNNMEWVTASQACMMANGLMRMNGKQRKAVYDLLGVNNGKK